MLFKKNQPGFSLIEVLIGLSLLGGVLICINAMGILAITQGCNAYYYTVANVQLDNMLERIRAHPQSEELSQQIAIWNQQNQKILPQGRGYVFNQYPKFKVNLFWGGKTSLQNCPLNSKKIKCISEEIAI